jgi:5-methylcytosine-specific restriction endonuclease McrA
MDHLIPLIRGGRSTKQNLVPACKKCNSEKHQQPLENYAIDKQKVYLLDKWDDIFSSALVINDKLFNGVLYV